MRAALLAPASAGDTYFTATAGFPTGNNTVIVDLKVRSYADDTYILSWSDGTLNWHIRTTATQMRLGRSAATALNLWSDSYTGRATIAATGTVTGGGSRAAYYRREKQNWVSVGTVTHSAITPTELLIGRAVAGTGAGTNPIDYWGFWIYNRQLSLAEIKEIDACPRDREPPLTQGLVYAWTAHLGALDFGKNHWRRAAFSFPKTAGSSLQIGTDWPIRVVPRRTVAAGFSTSTGAGGSTAAAQASAATGKATATAFGATANSAQATAATGAATSTATGATTQAAQLTAADGDATATGSGGSTDAAQVTAGKGIGNEGTGEGGSAATAQITEATGQGVATGTGGSSSATQASSGKGTVTHTGKGATANPAQVTAATGAAEAVGSGGSTAAPQQTSGYNPGGQPTSGNGMARRRLPPRDY